MSNHVTQMPLVDDRSHNIRNLRKFYNLREPKAGEAITYDRWYYLTYGIIDGLNYESTLRANNVGSASASQTLFTREPTGSHSS